MGCRVERGLGEGGCHPPSPFLYFVPPSGKGSFGKVYRALHSREGCFLAVKEIEINRATAREEELRLLTREISTLAQLKVHPALCCLAVVHSLQTRSCGTPHSGHVA